MCRHKGFVIFVNIGIRGYLHYMAFFLLVVQEYLEICVVIRAIYEYVNI